MLYSYQYPFVPETMPLWYVFIFIFGLCLGSFLNVCIWRIPRGESVVFGPSHCPNCNYRLKWYENIPVLSWLCLRGHCSNCKIPISSGYLFIELITGILIVADWWRVVYWHRPLPLFIFYTLATVLFIVTFFTDLKHKIIPNKLTYTIIIICFILAFFFPQGLLKDNSIDAFVNSFTGALIAGGCLAVVLILGKIILKKDALGWGDVKFIAAVGACFGLFPLVWFFTILVGSILGTVTITFLLLFKKQKWSAEIPFGPFLAVAGYLWILCGQELFDKYFEFIRYLVQL